ncbi:MAG: TonB-dependent receptor [Betaproteobacteria bacterium]
MHPRNTLAASALALLSTLPAMAADRETDAIVVTATRQATRSNELLSDVSVITREEIENAGQSTLEQLLARQPGIEYSVNGGAGTSSNIYIRGASSNQSIVLIDGLRVGSATTGSFAFSRIPLAQIERVEILRGPGSSLYGADAIGGVIQIFTRRGDGQTRYNASTGFGTNNTTDTSAGISGGTEAVSYNLQAGYYQTDGINARSNPAVSSFNPDRDGYRNNNLSGNLTFRPAAGHEFGLNVLNSNGTNRYDSGTATTRMKDYAVEQNVSSYSAYSRNRLAPSWTSTLRAGHSIDDLTNRTDGNATTAILTEQDQLSWQNDVKLPVGKALIATEVLKQKVSGTTAFQVNERTIRSVLAGWSGSFGEHRLQSNLRHDENSQFGGKTTGLAGYGYQLTTDWRAHVSYGTGFRAPTFNELYSPLNVPSNYQGNPNLRPEFSRNREVGIDWERGSHHFSTIYYNNKVTDLISGSGIPLQNVASATLAGATLSYIGNQGNWNGGASLDLQHARDDVTGNRLIRRADKQFKSHMDYTFSSWTVGGEWQLSDQRFDDTANKNRLGGYGLVNLLAEYRLEKDWKLFARANNIFDKKYELARDYATLGATVFFGVRYAPK